MSRRPAKSSSSQHSALSTQHCRASSQHSALSTQHSSVRPAFTFLEVLFAVIIIGIGVIMIAAMFPVAILQQQSNVNEAAAVSIGRDAIHYLQTSLDSVQPQTTLLASNATTTLPLLPCTMPTLVAGGPLTLATNGTLPIMPLPNYLVPLGAPYAAGQLAAQNSALSAAAYLANPAVLALTGNQLPSNDRRFAWLAFYRRDTIVTNINGVATATAAPYAQVWVFAAQSTVEGQPTFLSPPAIKGPGANFLNASLMYNAGGSYISFAGSAGNPIPAASNAFALIVSSATDATLIGQVVRLGSPVTQAQFAGLPGFVATDPAFTLLPGSDLNASDPNMTTGVSLNNNIVFVLGSPADPNNAGQYIGQVQDITVVRGYVRINN